MSIIDVLSTRNPSIFDITFLEIQQFRAFIYLNKGIFFLLFDWLKYEFEGRTLDTFIYLGFWLKY